MNSLIPVDACAMYDLIQIIRIESILPNGQFEGINSLMQYIGTSFKMYRDFLNLQTKFFSPFYSKSSNWSI